MLASLWCPTCGAGALQPDAAEHPRSWHCSQCQLRYRSYAIGDVHVPWLFARPGAAHRGWSDRLHAFLRSNGATRQRLCGQIARSGLSAAARERLTRLYDARSRLQETVLELLAGFRLEPSQDCAAQRSNDGLPQSQGLLSYRNNLFRDWAWNNGETDAMLDHLNAALFDDGGVPAEGDGRVVAASTELGRTLTLGSGAGRLSFDLHQQHQPSQSVLLDMNPLLCALTAAVVQGQTVEMPEFPIAPLSAEGACALQRCALPAGIGPATGDLTVVAADATAPPFAAASFDTVVTPWLVDILPTPLETFLPVLNRLLPIGGRWLNTGSLAFAHADASANYAPDEVPALIEAAGFRILSFKRSTQRYLQSPFSAHGRVEQVYTWHARKVADRLPCATVSSTPDWIESADVPIPLEPQYGYASAQHLLNAQVLGAIDGKRSLNTLARLLAQKHQLDEPTARSVIEAILLERNSSAGVGNG